MINKQHRSRSSQHCSPFPPGRFLVLPRTSGERQLLLLQLHPVLYSLFHSDVTYLRLARRGRTSNGLGRASHRAHHARSRHHGR